MLDGVLSCSTKHIDIGKVLDHHHCALGTADMSDAAPRVEHNLADTIHNDSGDAIATVDPTSWGWIYAADMRVTRVGWTDVTLVEV